MNRNPLEIGRAEAWAAGAALLAFVALALAVQAGALRALDFAFTPTIQSVAGPLLDTLAGAISIAFAFEAVALYAAIAALLLWRQGCGIWSLAPLSFMGLTAIELTLKTFMLTDPIPIELHRAVFY